jgi:hypothetical protein
MPNNQIMEDEMSRRCSGEKGEKCLQNFGLGKTGRKRTRGIPRKRF